MNWDALGAIAELLGAIAVFLTLAYLTVQVKQNSKALDLQNQFSAAQIMQARTDTLMSFNGTVLTDPELLSAANAVSNPESLDLSSMNPLERRRYWMMLNMARGMFENNFQQANRGFLSEDFYQGSVVPNIENFGEAFLIFELSMSTEFKAEVERVLGEKNKRGSNP